MHFQNKLNLSPKISDDLFLVIDLFHVLISYFSVVGAKSVADIDTGGGPKSLHFDKFTMLSLLFLPPRGGQTPLPTSMGGHGRICPRPHGSATEYINLKIYPNRVCPDM